MLVLPVVPVWLHGVFESLACFVGFRMVLHARAKDTLPMDKRSLVMGAAIVGAALGAKLTVIGDNPSYYFSHWQNWTIWLPGKGIAGALVGGLLSVEFTKRLLGIREATGDLFVTPLIFALIIGRLGCFLSGLADHTYGIETRLPWGVDFGDGLFRHPVQVYEILFLLGLYWLIHSRKGYSYQQGAVFQWFMLGYFTFRLGIEFLKPIPALYFGFNSVQLLALTMMIYYRKAWVSLLTPWLNQKQQEKPL